jgi:hypothetical protein
MPRSYNLDIVEPRIQMEIGDRVRLREFEEAGVIFFRVHYIAKAAFLSLDGKIYVKHIDRRYMLPLCLNPCSVVEPGDKDYQEAWRALKLGSQAA